MHGIVVRATILHLARRYIAMKTTTQARLQRTAAEAVGSIPGIEAVVLFGSRARGTTRAASDWDVAILSHANSDDERAARRLFGELEQVSPIVMQPESIEEHCNQGLRIESAIARQGRLLAGDWTPPPCRSVDLDVKPEDFRQNLDTATRDLRSASVALCDAALNEVLYVPNVVEYSQHAAEALAKTVIAGFGLSPATVHDLDKLAGQIENAYRGRTAMPRKECSSPRPSGNWTAIRRPLIPLAITQGRWSRRSGLPLESDARCGSRRAGFTGTPSDTPKCGKRQWPRHRKLPT